MDTANLIIECLRFAVCGSELDKSLFYGMTENDFNELYIQSKRHDIAHLVGAALDKAELLKNPETAEKFAKQQLTAVYRCENIIYETDRITSALSEAKIDHIPLKGSVIREFYPEAWMRTSCDIDILVRENDLDAAKEVLVQKLGYTVDGGKKYHDVSLYSASGVHLELHFNIKENIEQLDRVLSCVWEYAIPVTETRYKQSNEFLMYHIAAHMAYHFMGGGCGIRPFLDLWLIKNKLDLDEALVLELCRTGEIDSFYLAAVSLADYWFSGKECSDIAKRMQDYVLGGGVYGTKESKIAAMQESRGGKKGYLISRIWTSYDDLKLRYPSLNSRVAIPIYQVRRWIDIVLEGNFKRSMRELKLNRELDENKVSDIQKLMHDLRLNDHIK